MVSTSQSLSHSRSRRRQVTIVASIAVGLLAILVARTLIGSDAPEPRVPTPLTRDALRVAAFGSTRLPDTMPTVVRNWKDPRFPDAARLDKLTVRLPYGLRSVAYDLWPKRWNGRVMIFHNGHEEDLDASPQVLEWFLRRGWRVVTMTMPLAGPNWSPKFKYVTHAHNQFAGLERPLGLFLLPVVEVVNYTHAHVMVGLSGGGWTTSVAAAIDPRIRLSYPVAGSLPAQAECLPKGPGCVPDLEQQMIPDYIRLYELGSDPPRRELAFYNLHDPCCYAGRSSDSWAREVRGDFAAIVDPLATRHAVTISDLRTITQDIARHTANDR